MESVAVTWWMWCTLGLLLLIAEFATPGAFYQFFFGVGAIAVGLIMMTGLGLSFSVQVLLFLVLSIGSLALLRKPLRARFNEEDGHEVDQIQGTSVIAIGAIAVNATGKAELRGTQWSARNVGNSPIEEAQLCRVIRVDGLTLEIESEAREKIGG